MCDERFPSSALESACFSPPCRHGLCPGLTAADLPEVLAAATRLQAGWQDLGLALGVPAHELEAIDVSTREPREALRKTLLTWLRGSGPTWRELVAAAAGRIVGQAGVAADIARQHCPEILGTYIVSVYKAQFVCRSEEKMGVLPAEVGRAEIGGGVANPEGGVVEESEMLMYIYLYTMLPLALSASSLPPSLSFPLPTLYIGLHANDLATVYEATIPLQARWHDLGLALRIPSHELDAAAMSTREPKEALKRVLRLWLDRVSPRPTWQALVLAVAGKIVDQGSVAVEIARKHCPGVLGECWPCVYEHVPRGC